MSNDAPSAALSRLAPLALVLVAAVVAWALGLFDYLNVAALGEHRAALVDFTHRHYGLALTAYFALFFALAVCAVPGVLWLIMIGGFLFGPLAATGATWAAGLLGGAGLFLIARGGLQPLARQRLGPILERMETGFRREEALYLLSIRFSPFVPYVAANIAPALLGARFKTFLWTSAVGLLPSVALYAWLGAELGVTLEQGAPGFAAIARQVAPPLFALSLLPVCAVVLRRLRKPR